MHLYFTLIPESEPYVHFLIVVRLCGITPAAGHTQHYTTHNVTTIFYREQLLIRHQGYMLKLSKYSLAPGTL